MKAQLLATVIAFALVYFLLRLRHFILACGKDKRKYYRAYIVRFDETDWDSGADDDSNEDSSADGNLIEWPTELEIQIGLSTHMQENSDEPGTEAASAPAIILPKS